MSLINIPYQHILTVDVQDVIRQADSTQCFELILLAEKKLAILLQDDIVNEDRTELYALLRKEAEEIIKAIPD